MQTPGLGDTVIVVTPGNLARVETLWFDQLLCMTTVRGSALRICRQRTRVTVFRTA